MITIHEDNHLGVLCKKIAKQWIKDGEFVSIAEFEEQQESGYFSFHDCDAQWACKDSEGVIYGGNSVTRVSNKPYWATHIFWTSK